MYYPTVLAALAGFASLVAAAPASNHKSRHVVERASNSNKNNKNNNGGSVVISDNTIIIQQTVVQPQITIVEENLGLISQLALQVEQEFSALVQAQLALVQEVETIKNNIRINHFLARFQQVNTVIVSVTELVDLRGGSNSRNSRYMVNQLLADNGKPESSVVVMLTAASPVTINAAQPTLDLAGLLGANGSALPSGVVASVVAAASASASASASAAFASAATTSNSTSTSTNGGSLKVAAFDPNNPFGQIGQTIILPYGSKAPSLPNGAQIVADPASIILPNQRNLLVEDITQFNQDCALYASNSLSLFNLQSSVLQEAAAIAALEVSGLSLGSSATLNSAAAALLGSAGGSIVNIGSASVATAAAAATTTTTSSSVATSTTVSSSSSSSSSTTSTTAAATTSAAVAAAPAVEATSAAAVAAAAAVVSSSAAAPAAAAPAASAASGAGGGVGVQIVPVPAAA
ncbi:hypothetical protein SCUCBS95973_006502 [Sporothrix curviconia]|uniref:Cell wall protein n=1 Tax=Sporothrix curviconia TaxID=1260050 RepID=A0ABP0C5P7_9PEZI